MIFEGGPWVKLGLLEMLNAEVRTNAPEVDVGSFLLVSVPEEAAFVSRLCGSCIKLGMAPLGELTCKVGLFSDLEYELIVEATDEAWLVLILAAAIFATLDDRHPLVSGKSNCRNMF